MSTTRHQARVNIGMHGIIDRAEPHRTGTGQQRHGAIGFDAHLMHIHARLGVICGVRSPDDTAHGLAQRGVEKPFPHSAAGSFAPSPLWG